MKYDEKEERLLISAHEFTAIARRGISGESCDGEDNDELSESVRKKSRYLPDGAEEIRLSLNDELDGIPATVHCVGHIKNNELLLVKEYEGTRKAPKKSEVSLARGEGFTVAHLFAKAYEHTSVLLTIIYINKNNGVRTDTKEAVSARILENFYNKCKTAVAKYAIPEIHRVTVRLPSLKKARFPYGRVRDGQNEFMSLVYKNLTRGGTLYAAAPTGTGKTVSVLYPAVRALGDGRCDKIFYFTPKTTTAIAAKECIEDICAQGAVIRAVTIGAKERVCRRGVLCRDGKGNCPSKLGESVINAALELYGMNISVVTDADILPIAEKFSVCPHELSLTYSELCDVIILDINYLFDPRVYIKRYFTNGGDFAFLIDEAHNLPDRAREMYSCEISTDEILEPSESALLGEHSCLREITEALASACTEVLYPHVKDEMRADKNGVMHGFAHTSEPPGELYDIFDRLTEAAEAELLLALRAKDSEREPRIKYIRDYLAKVKRVSDTLNAYTDGYETFIRKDGERLSLKLFCIDTSDLISKRLEKGRATVFFSATLSPISYYRSVLGGDRASGVLEIDSPFDSSQLCVTVMDKISTRYSEREDTLLAVSRAIAATVSAKRGHYMIFSPSFAYSEALARVFASKYPKIKVMSQTRDMTKAAKADFLAEFQKNEGTYLVAFCVMGGIYSEGIDLAGDSLIGAVIVGIGMPSLSEEREAIAAYYDEKCDEGKQYAYIYPGMNRVFQAAGRVIRREGDRGVIVLIDDRFADPIYKKSIPTLWKDMEFSSDPKALRARLDEFWDEQKNTDTDAP